MGRALFSHAYSPAPVVRTEPEPVNEATNWSHWNPFDPDSDEFFEGAVYEAFVEPGQFHPTGADEQSDPVVVEGRTSNDVGVGGDTGEESDLPRLSYPLLEWNRTIARSQALLPPSIHGIPTSDIRRLRPPTNFESTPGLARPNRRRSASMSTTLSLDTWVPPSHISIPSSQESTRRRLLSSGPDESSPESSAPSTPEPQYVTPDQYIGFLVQMPPSWSQRTPLPSISLSIPTRPSSPQNNGSSLERGPLTNPNARVSHARIVPAPPPVLAQELTM